jgi:hypothetical protein
MKKPGIAEITRKPEETVRVSGEYRKIAWKT